VSEPPKVELRTREIAWLGEPRTCYQVWCSSCSLDWCSPLIYHDYAAEMGVTQHLQIHEEYEELLMLAAAFLLS